MTGGYAMTRGGSGGKPQNFNFELLVLTVVQVPGFHLHYQTSQRTGQHLKMKEANPSHPPEQEVSLDILVVYPTSPKRL